MMAEFLLPGDTNGEINESQDINSGNSDDPSKEKDDMEEEVSDVIRGILEKISEALRAEKTENNVSHGINNGNGDDPSKQKHDMEEEVNDVIRGRFHDKDIENISEDILRAEMENTEHKGYEKDVDFNINNAEKMAIVDLDKCDKKLKMT